MTRPPRQSIAPTYDSRETGPRYHVTTWLNGRPVTWEHRIDDPFVRHTVTIGWPDLLRSLLRGRAEVDVSVGADPDVMEDVLELDDNYRGRPGSTRHAAFDQDLRGALSRFGTDGDA